MQPAANWPAPAGPRTSRRYRPIAVEKRNLQFFVGYHHGRKPHADTRPVNIGHGDSEIGCIDNRHLPSLGAHVRSQESTSTFPFIDDRLGGWEAHRI